MQAVGLRETKSLPGSHPAIVTQARPRTQACYPCPFLCDVLKGRVTDSAYRWLYQVQGSARLLGTGSQNNALGGAMYVGVFVPVQRTWPSGSLENGVKLPGGGKQACGKQGA